MARPLNIKLNTNLVAESGTGKVQRPHVFYHTFNATGVKENDRTLAATYGYHLHRLRSCNFICTFERKKSILGPHHSIWYAHLGCTLFWKTDCPPGNALCAHNTYNCKYCSWNEKGKGLASYITGLLEDAIIQGATVIWPSDATDNVHVNVVMTIWCH